jgi:hypothetical protein
MDDGWLLTTDTLTFGLHSVKIPVGFGYFQTSKEKPMSVLPHLKRNEVGVNAEENCLAHALLIAVARVTKNPDYTA